MALMDTIGFYIGLILGVLCIGFGCYMYWQRWCAQKWASTDGVITSSKIKRKYGKTYFEELEVSYVFQVNEKEYQGSSLTAGGDVSWTLFPGVSSARINQKDYHGGARVTVYFDKERPINNALSRGNKNIAFFPIVSGIVVLLIVMVSGRVIG